MPKAPPLNPRDYKSRTSKISLREGRLNVQKNVQKSSKKRKKVDNGLFLIKKVDKDALVQINVISLKLDRILYAPNVANLGFRKI